MKHMNNFIKSSSNEKAKLYNKKLIWICCILACLFVVTLMIYIKSLGFDIRANVFKYIVTIILIILGYLVLIQMAKKKSFKLFITFIIILFAINYNISTLESVEDVCIINNIKVEKAKTNGKLNGYRYISGLLVSSKYIPCDYYNYENLNIENDQDVYLYNMIKKYENTQIEIISKDRYDLKETMNMRIQMVITNDEELEALNEKNYIFERINSVDFNNYILIVISYNEKEAVPYYLGMKDDTINFVINNMKNNNFSKLMIIKINKIDFNYIEISDFKKYENPI